MRLLPSAHDLVSGSVKFTATPIQAKLLGHERVTRRLLTKRYWKSSSAGQCSSPEPEGLGSEISRQVSELSVSKVILLDQDENSLNSATNSPSRMLICCGWGHSRCADARSPISALSSRRRARHAAAYKHVPVMEANRSEAVLNNVRGTRELVDAAVRYGCERFVIVSRTKRCNPASVMGATKRTAEMIVQEQCTSGSQYEFWLRAVRRMG